MTKDDAADLIAAEYLKKDSEKTVIPVVAGPTASGKTYVAVRLAGMIGGEIISADSMQIYKYMDIGTAKPTASEQTAARHHLIDIRYPWEDYSAADFVKDAKSCIRDILSRNKAPIVCGGTGLYISSLTEGFTFREDPENKEEIMDEINRLYESSGIRGVYECLEKEDENAAREIHINNEKRVIRALYLKRATGKTRQERNDLSKEPSEDISYKVFVLDPPREKLYENIDLRCEKMLEEGLKEETVNLLEECKKAYEKGRSPSPGLGRTASQAIGYKEMFDCYSGLKSEREALEFLKMSTRRYAKRQLTWFRRMPGAVFIHID